MKTQPRITLTSRLLPSLVGLLLVMQLIAPSRVWALLLVGLSGLWVVSFLWARSLGKSLFLVREMRFGWAQVGDRLEERFTLYNPGWVPGLWVEVSDRSNIPGYQASLVTGVESSSFNSWRRVGLCTQRGMFKLGPASLRSGDPFGVYKVEINDPASTTLLVMPPIVPLPNIEVAPGGKAGDGRPRRDAPERTASAAGVREFSPGDNLRWIHWPTTARRDSPFVRLFDGTPAGDWWIILDVDKNVQAGQGWDSTIEHGVILAASLADRGIRLKRGVGLAANGEELVWLPPKEGEAQRWEILRSLAFIKPGSHSLAELLVKNKPSISQRASLILITPNTRGDWIEPLLPLLWRGAVASVLLLDPVTFGGQGSTLSVISLLESMGVARYAISRDLLDRPEARPGYSGQWEFRISSTGRAIPLRKPSGLGWRTLS